jgi:hypothetical protein
VDPMFPVSLDNPCLIVTSVFSNVYLTSPLLFSVSRQQREVIYLCDRGIEEKPET